MKFYEEKSPVERRVMILKAVRGSALIEGMNSAAEKCRQELFELQERQKKQIKQTLQAEDQTNQ